MKGWDPERDVETSLVQESGGKEVSAPSSPSSLMELVPRCNMPLRFCESQPRATVLGSVFF